MEEVWWIGIVWHLCQTDLAHRQAARRRHPGHISIGRKKNLCHLEVQTAFPAGQSKVVRSVQFAYDTLVGLSAHLLRGANRGGRKSRVLQQGQARLSLVQQSPNSQRKAGSSSIGTGQSPAGKTTLDQGLGQVRAVHGSNQHDSRSTSDAG